LNPNLKKRFEITKHLKHVEVQYFAPLQIIFFKPGFGKNKMESVPKSPCPRISRIDFIEITFVSFVLFVVCRVNSKLECANAHVLANDP